MHVHGPIIACMHACPCTLDVVIYTYLMYIPKDYGALPHQSSGDNGRPSSLSHPIFDFLLVIPYSPHLLAQSRITVLKVRPSRSLPLLALPPPYAICVSSTLGNTRKWLCLMGCPLPRASARTTMTTLFSDARHGRNMLHSPTRWYVTRDIVVLCGDKAKGKYTCIVYHIQLWVGYEYLR